MQTFPTHFTNKKEICQHFLFFFVLVKLLTHVQPEMKDFIVNQRAW